MEKMQCVEWDVVVYREAIGSLGHGDDLSLIWTQTMSVVFIGQIRFCGYWFTFSGLAENSQIVSANYPTAVKHGAWC